MEQLLEILEDLVPGGNFEGRTGLVDDGVLDSFTILNLISEISDEFGVDIPVSEVVPENFDSVETIMALIEKVGR
ncbi:MAG: acyl carrier protein [Wujia sp.]